MYIYLQHIIYRAWINKRNFREASFMFILLALMTLKAVGQEKSSAKAISLTNEMSELNKVFNKAFITKDIDELLSGYDKELILLPPNAPKSKGIEGIKGLYEYVIANDIALKHNVAEIEFSEDYSQAVVIGSYETKGDSFSDEGKYLFVLKRKNAAWTIVIDMFSSNKPMEEE